MFHQDVSSLIISAARRKSTDAFASFLSAQKKQESSALKLRSLQTRKPCVSSEAAAAMCTLMSSSSLRDSPNNNLSKHFVAPWDTALWLLRQASIRDVATWRPNVLKNFSDNMEQRILEEALTLSPRRPAVADITGMIKKKPTPVAACESLWTGALKIVAALRSQEVLERISSASALSMSLLLLVSSSTSSSLRKPTETWKDAMMLFSRHFLVHGPAGCSFHVRLLEETLRRETARLTQQSLRRKSGDPAERMAAIFSARGYYGETLRKITSLIQQRKGVTARDAVLVVLDSNGLHHCIESNEAENDEGRKISSIAWGRIEDFLQGLSPAGSSGMPVILLVPLCVHDEVLSWIRREVTARNEASAQLLEERLNELLFGSPLGGEEQDCAGTTSGEISRSRAWLRLSVWDALAAAIVPDPACEAAREIDLRRKHLLRMEPAGTSVVDLHVAQQYHYIKARWPAKRVVLVTFDKKLAGVVRRLGGDVPDLRI